MLTRAHVAALTNRVRTIRVAPIDLFFAFCALLALRALLQRGFDALGYYDEGLLFTNAQLMNDGRVIYRDFYAIYPPAIFQVVRGVMALTDNPIWWVRCLTFFVRLLTALGTGWLVGRARGGRFCMATASAVLLLQVVLGLVAYAYTFAVLLCIVIIASWPDQAAPRWRRMGAGALFASWPTSAMTCSSTRSPSWPRSKRCHGSCSGERCCSATDDSSLSSR